MLGCCSVAGQPVREGLVQRHEEFCATASAWRLAAWASWSRPSSRTTIRRRQSVQRVAFAHAGREAGGDLDQELVAHVVAQVSRSLSCPGR